MDSMSNPEQVEDVQLQTVDELPKGLSSLLREVHEVAGRALQSTLREWAKAAITVTPQDELQAPYSEFTRTLELPVAIASISSAALSTNFLLCLDAPMASAVTETAPCKKRVTSSMSRYITSRLIFELRYIPPSTSVL